MIFNNRSEYIDMFDYWIGMREPDGLWILSIPVGERERRVFDLSGLDEKRLNQLIDESVETGVDKVYEAVKEYEIGMRKSDPNVVY